MTITLQPATAADVDALVATQLFNNTPHNLKWNMKCYCVCWASNVPDGFDVRPEEAIALQFVKNGNLQGYLAYSDGEIIGWCNANTKAECQNSLGWQWGLKSVPIDDAKVVKSIFCYTIAPEFQRKGIATQLLERVCKDAAEDGFDFVEVYPNKTVTAESENHGGFAEMYKRLGFTVYAELENICVMRKEL
jgi:ribosomal protein S18 acetylase RimI-like enzyme